MILSIVPPQGLETERLGERERVSEGGGRFSVLLKSRGYTFLVV